MPCRSTRPSELLLKKASQLVNSDPMMVHSTYFSLKPDGSPDTRAKYIAACHEFLSSSPGIMSFWVGERAEDMQRSVNDQNFNVAMNQVFQNRAAFDHYNGQDPMHEKFIEVANKLAPATTRRVYDSYLNRLSYIDGQPSVGQVTSTGAEPRLFHSIYFTLTTSTTESRATLTEICLTFLTNHPGVRCFALGELADLKRDVSVSNYDIALNILWKDKTFYEQYLKSKSHDDFFPATKGMIKNTQVFDSYLG